MLRLILIICIAFCIDKCWKLKKSCYSQCVVLLNTKLLGIFWSILGPAIRLIISHRSKKTADYKITCYFILGRSGKIEKADSKMFVDGPSYRNHRKLEGTGLTNLDMYYSKYIFRLDSDIFGYSISRRVHSYI